VISIQGFLVYCTCLGIDGNTLTKQTTPPYVIKLLHGAGIRGDFKLVDCRFVESDRNGVAAGGEFQTNFRLNGKESVMARCDRHGHLSTLSIDAPYNGKNPAGSLVTDPKLIQHAKELILKLGVKGKPIFVPSQSTILGDRVTVIFAQKLYDLTFYGEGQMSGFSMVQFNRKTGVPNEFMSGPSFPEVNATRFTKPRLVAESIFKSWIRTHQREIDDTNSVNDPRHMMIFSYRTELGYYQFKNEQKARLVWVEVVSAHNKQGTDNRDWYVLPVCVDAVTGSLLNR